MIKAIILGVVSFAFLWIAAYFMSHDLYFYAIAAMATALLSGTAGCVSYEIAANGGVLPLRREKKPWFNNSTIQ